MSYPYVPADASHTGGANGAVTRVVMHATVSPCAVGGARNVARYFQSPSAGGSAHYVVDPSETICCVKEDVVAYHAPPNHGSLGVELCDPQSGPDSRWVDDLHAKTLARAAILVADLCRRHGVPVVYVNAADLVAGRHGITTHAQVSGAFHQSDHSDPGSGFPMAHFLDLVRAASAPVKAQAVAAPKPVAIPKEPRMIVRFAGHPDVFEVIGSHLEHLTAEAYAARGKPAVTDLPANHPLAALPRTSGAA